MATMHKISGGISGLIPSDGSLVTSNLSIPANATVKKVLFAGMEAQGRDVLTSGTAVTPLILEYYLSFTTGFYAGRQLFHTMRLVPWTVTVFLATAIPTYNVYYAGGDLELGFDQQMSFGGNGKPASNLRFTLGAFVPAGSHSFVVGMTGTLTAFYSLP